MATSDLISSVRDYLPETINAQFTIKSVDRTNSEIANKTSKNSTVLNATVTVGERDIVREFAELDANSTMPDIYRAMYRALKVMAQAMPNEQNPLHICVPPECVKAAVKAGWSAYQELKTPPTCSSSTREVSVGNSEQQSGGVSLMHVCDRLDKLINGFQNLAAGQTTLQSSFDTASQNNQAALQSGFGSLTKTLTDGQTNLQSSFDTASQNNQAALQSGFGSLTKTLTDGQTNLQSSFDTASQNNQAALQSGFGSLTKMLEKLEHGHTSLHKGFEDFSKGLPAKTQTSKS
jgi:hypothetical protein